MNSTILFLPLLFFLAATLYMKSSSDLDQSSSNFKDRILTFRSSFVNALSFEWKNVVKKKWISRRGYRRTLYRAWDMTFKNAYTYNGYCCCGFRYSNLSIYDQYWLFFYGMNVFWWINVVYDDMLVCLKNNISACFCMVVHLTFSKLHQNYIHNWSIHIRFILMWLIEVLYVLFCYLFLFVWHELPYFV